MMVTLPPPTLPHFINEIGEENNKICCKKAHTFLCALLSFIRKSMWPIVPSVCINPISGFLYFYPCPSVEKNN